MTNANDSTYPILATSLAEAANCCAGLTKREHFAALNHAAILTAAAFNRGVENMLKKAGVTGVTAVEDLIAQLAIDAADALIRNLNE